MNSARETGSKMSKGKSVLALLLLVLLANSSVASTVLSMEVDELVGQSELIFEGVVLQHDVQQEFGTGIINTYVTFAVVDVVKGEFDPDQLELKFAGGTLNGETVEISGLVLPEVGEEGIYFVESISRNLINPLLGWSQGHYLIIEQEGERLVNTVSQSPVTDVMAVSDIPQTIRRPQTLIESNTDAAVGIVSEVSALNRARALSVDEFKDRIQGLIDNQIR